MRLTRRLWSQQGYLFVEPAGDTECYWMDHLGRIGIEDEHGWVTWHVIEGNRFLADERQEHKDIAQVAMDDLRLYGVVGNKH